MVEYAYTPNIETIKDTSFPQRSKDDIRKMLESEIGERCDFLIELPSIISNLRARVQQMDSHKIHKDKDKGVFIVHYIDEESPFDLDMRCLEMLGERVDENKVRRILKSNMISLIEMCEKCFIYVPERIKRLTSILNSL